MKLENWVPFFPQSQSTQVKRTPHDYINEFIIRKLNPLIVAGCGFQIHVCILACVMSCEYSHSIQLRNFYQLSVPEFDVNVSYEF